MFLRGPAKYSPHPVAPARAARMTFFHILEAWKINIKTTSKKVAKVVPMTSQTHPRNHEKVTLERKRRHRVSMHRANVLQGLGPPRWSKNSTTNGPLFLLVFVIQFDHRNVSKRTLHHRGIRCVQFVRHYFHLRCCCSCFDSGRPKGVRVCGLARPPCVFVTGRLETRKRQERPLGPGRAGPGCLPSPRATHARAHTRLYTCTHTHTHAHAYPHTQTHLHTQLSGNYPSGEDEPEGT